MLTLAHKSLMIQSYNNSSFSPERRGEQDFDFYQSQLEQDLALIQSIKGYALFEAKEQTEYQKRQTGRSSTPGKTPQQTETKVLFTFKVV